ncbi:MAG: hypothetical protein M1814_005759 [Vezdaea aestivalis]|nr:MAG: hypothetical protein M1814_005759 [Vezdaea aestivalis]
MQLPSIPYSPQSSGYWDPITATLNFCEEEYYATPYIAEVVNTLTNVIFVYLAFRGLRSCFMQGHHPMFIITFLGYLCVGLGSTFFHATLKYPMQLIDELSMIYTTCLMFHTTFSYQRSSLQAFLLASSLVSLCLFITLYYHYIQDPLFHQYAYALLTAIVLFRSIYMMQVHLRPELTAAARRHQRSSSEVARKQRDAKILREMWTMVGAGLGTFLSGFAIWSLDNSYCSPLRKWRHEVGLPWGIVAEGHGWW